MSNEDCSIVSVICKPVESSCDITTSSDRVLMSLDMSSEPFSGDASDSGRLAVDEPETGRRPSSGQANRNPEGGSSPETVPEFGESLPTSVCVHCHGTGNSGPSSVFLDRTIVETPTVSTTPVMYTASTMSTVAAQSTAAPTNSKVSVKDAESAKTTVVSTRPKSRLRSRSRVNRKKRTAGGGRSKGSGDTCDIATPPPLLRSSDVRVHRRRTTIDLTTSTDSDDEESVSGNGSYYSSGDRQRSVRFDKKTVAKASRKAVTATRTIENARPSTRNPLRSRQYIRKHHYRSTTPFDK